MIDPDHDPQDRPLWQLPELRSCPREELEDLLGIAFTAFLALLGCIAALAAVSQ